MADAPVVAIVVTKRNPLVTIGRPQKYRWHALNWGNRKTLAVSSEAYTNRVDALAAAVQLFADTTADAEALAKAGFTTNVSERSFLRPFTPANVYLIEDGVSGMQALRVQAAA